MTITEKEVEAILNTLQAIEVKGFDNLNRVMALIHFFEGKKKEESEKKDG